MNVTVSSVPALVVLDCSTHDVTTSGDSSLAVHEDGHIPGVTPIATTEFVSYSSSMSYPPHAGDCELNTTFDRSTSTVNVSLTACVPPSDTVNVAAVAAAARSARVRSTTPATTPIATTKSSTDRRPTVRMTGSSLDGAETQNDPTPASDRWQHPTNHASVRLP